MSNSPARKSFLTNLRVPGALHWAARLGTLGVLLAIAATALWIAAGRADPPTAGPVVWSDALPWAASALPADAETWWSAPQDRALPPDAFTLSVRATLAAGTSPLAAWGVWIAADDGTRAVFALDAGGYWTIRACPDPPPPILEDCPALAPEWRWSPFPRIAAPGDRNTLTLHTEPDGALRLRLNQERLGAPAIVAAGPWGLWGRGGPSQAAITWERAELRAARD